MEANDRLQLVKLLHTLDKDTVARIVSRVIDVIVEEVSVPEDAVLPPIPEPPELRKLTEAEIIEMMNPVFYEEDTWAFPQMWKRILVEAKDVETFFKLMSEMVNSNAEELSGLSPLVALVAFKANLPPLILFNALLVYVQRGFDNHMSRFLQVIDENKNGDVVMAVSSEAYQALAALIRSNARETDTGRLLAMALNGIYNISSGISQGADEFGSLYSIVIGTDSVIAAMASILEPIQIGKDCWEIETPKDFLETVFFEEVHFIKLFTDAASTYLTGKTCTPKRKLLETRKGEQHDQASDNDN